MNTPRSFSSSLLQMIPSIAHAFGAAGVPVAHLFSSSGALMTAWPTHQVHGARVHVWQDMPQQPVEADAFITDRSNVICSVRTADCVPILLCDARGRAVGAVHAGWRGTAENIAGATVSAFAREFGVTAQELRAAIGPCICERCFEIGAEVAHALDIVCDGEHAHADLAKINCEQLCAAGMRPEFVQVLRICTACSNQALASWRRTRTSDRQYSAIVKC